MAALAGLAGAAAIVGFQLLQRHSSPPAAPPVLGSFVQLEDQQVNARFGDARRALGRTGIHDATLGVYVPASDPSPASKTVFILVAGKTSGSMPDAAAEIREESAAFGELQLGNHFSESDQTIGGSTFTCGTFTATTVEESTCVWQSSSRVLFGLGVNVSPTDTTNLASLAKLDLGFDG